MINDACPETFGNRFWECVLEWGGCVPELTLLELTFFRSSCVRAMLQFEESLEIESFSV